MKPGPSRVWLVEASMMWTWLALAVAGTPLVYEEGDKAELITATAERTGLAEDQFDAVRLADLLKQPPAATGDGVLRRCAGDSVPSSNVRTELARAQSAWSDGNTMSATDHLDLAVAQLGCLGELVEGPIASKVFMLRASLAAERGGDSAQGEMQTAVAFDPDAQFKEGYPAAGEALLAQVQLTEPESWGKVSTAPAGTGTGPWIDGKQVGGEPLKVRPGLHLAQYPSNTGIRSAWLVVGVNTTLVLPGQFRPPIADGILEEGASRTEIEALLIATIPEFAGGYFTHKGGLWLVGAVDGVASTSEVHPPTLVEEPTEEPNGKKGKKGKKGK